ncbi:MAG: hypothetical protein NC311_04265 [Muribaculaceae bacterium]|nr:hypothetical protein [Muribaculaceae bacterium]
MKHITLTAIINATMPLRTHVCHDVVVPDFSTDIATIKSVLDKEERTKEIVRQIVHPKIDINIKQR